MLSSKVVAALRGLLRKAASGGFGGAQTPRHLVPGAVDYRLRRVRPADNVLMHQLAVVEAIQRNTCNIILIRESRYIKYLFMNVHK